MWNDADNYLIAGDWGRPDTARVLGTAGHSQVSHPAPAPGRGQSAPRHPSPLLPAAAARLYHGGTRVLGLLRSSVPAQPHLVGKYRR